VSQESLRTTRRFRRRTVRVLVEYLSDTGLRCETATTLGPGGLFIETDSPLVIGSLLKLRFRLSDTGIDHEIEGRVVWSKGDADGSVGTPGMGVEFLDRAATRILGRELESLD
jgi:Tfp pilus assembly protein PilZ